MWYNYRCERMVVTLKGTKIKTARVAGKLIFIFPDNNLDVGNLLKLVTASYLAQRSMRDGIGYDQLLDNYITSLRWIKTQPVYKNILKKAQERVNESRGE